LPLLGAIRYKILLLQVGLRLRLVFGVRSSLPNLCHDLLTILQGDRDLVVPVTEVISGARLVDWNEVDVPTVGLKRDR
jgi:hypothetical protein